MQAEERIYGTQESSALSVRRGSGNVHDQWMLKKSDPVTVTVWTYYNGDQLDAFNDLTEKFNDTVGKKDGITVETKSLGTAEDLEQNVLAAVNGEVGASEVPNIFSAYSDTAYTMDQRSPEDTIPALYIRDLDPDSLPPEKNTDLLMERSPVELVKSMGISTDKGWKSQMFVSDESTQKIIYPVFQEAFKDQGRLDAADYGHWTTEDYILDGDNRSAIAYSIPLILSDGTVYGVLGTEMHRFLTSSGY